MTHRYDGITAAILAVCTAAFACACTGRQPLLPRSGGEPYEVLLASDNDTVMAGLKSVLQTGAEGLAQREDAFDVSAIQGTTLSQATRYARCIIVATTDAERFSQTNIKYEKNVYADPQLIIYVNSPSADRLTNALPRISTGLTGLIERFELNAEAGRLRQKHNPKAEKAVNDMTGCSILIPADMTAEKRGKNFIWLSDNSASAMRNICIYAYRGTNTGAKEQIRMRDSVMRANIPGERQGMHMQTGRQADVTQRIITERGRDITVTRGQWEMSGDAMGGPFVSHALTDSINGRTLVAEAFVYAPGKRKRNKIKQLEAALYTLSLTKQ